MTHTRIEEELCEKEKLPGGRVDKQLLMGAVCTDKREGAAGEQVQAERRL